MFTSEHTKHSYYRERTMKQKSIKTRQRTVVLIDADILRLAKATAARYDMALWQLIEKALRCYLAEKGEKLEKTVIAERKPQ